MKTKILIVEDQFIEANNLRLILTKAGYQVCGMASSVTEAERIIETEKPQMVLLDIYLRGRQTGIDLATTLMHSNTAYVYLSANSNRETLDAAKATNPYGFLVKPFREKDVLVMLEVALYRYEQEQKGFGKLKEPVLAHLSQNNCIDNIIGKSKSFMDVLGQVKIVAPGETAVLILGESGTGKELIAKAIHRLSGRQNKPIVVVNCAALPANLIESELFGHEKGSFTGASEKRIGKFEQADGGTVFLDEIGELPLDLQVKFLRVLQEKEIEPIGGKCKKINVRVVAATNKNLEQEMANGRFRIDLYYRLNVFPIMLPSLRERRADIELLAAHFIWIFAKKMNKQITGLSEEALKTMLDYSWPGNIRELENVMERTVLMTSGSIITTVLLPAGKVNGSGASNSYIPSEFTDRVKTITENERDHILAALEMCAWKLRGSNGAAKLLDIHPSTLLSRMKKLGIEKKVGIKSADF